MKIGKRIVKILLILVILGAITVGYAFKIEPKLLVAENILLDYAASDAPEQIKIVQFSDTHLGEGYSLEQLEKAVKKINEQKADFVIFTGDLMDSAYTYEEQDEAAKILGEIEAGMEKLAVWGNHDIGGGGIRVYGDMMEQAGFTLLRNESLRLPFTEGHDIVFSGLDDGMLGQPDYSTVAKREREEDFHVLISHSPDPIENVEKENVDLTLSGHSHGGQIKLPFIGPLVKVPLAKIYYDGLYSLNSGKLYVNTGLGTTKIHARLFNPPAITVFRLTVF